MLYLQDLPPRLPASFEPVSSTPESASSMLSQSNQQSMRKTVISKPSPELIPALRWTFALDAVVKQLKFF